MRGQLRSLAVYPRKKSTRYPTKRRLGGPLSQSRRCREDKNVPCPRRDCNRVETSTLTALRSHDGSNGTSEDLRTVKYEFTSLDTQGCLRCVALRFATCPGSHGNRLLCSTLSVVILNPVTVSLVECTSRRGLSTLMVTS
jgi:hypothetical protein